MNDQALRIAARGVVLALKKRRTTIGSRVVGVGGRGGKGHRRAARTRTEAKAQSTLQEGATKGRTEGGGSRRPALGWGDWRRAGVGPSGAGSARSARVDGWKCGRDRTGWALTHVGRGARSTWRMWVG